MVIATGVLQGNLHEIMEILQNKYNWGCKFSSKKNAEVYTNIDNKKIKIKLSDIGGKNILVEASNKKIFSPDYNSNLKAYLFDMFDKVMNLKL